MRAPRNRLYRPRVPLLFQISDLDQEAATKRERHLLAFLGGWFSSAKGAAPRIALRRSYASDRLSPRVPPRLAT